MKLYRLFVLASLATIVVILSGYRPLSFEARSRITYPELQRSWVMVGWNQQRDQLWLVRDGWLQLRLLRVERPPSTGPIAPSLPVPVGSLPVRR